jgi:hypothetical protein
MAMPSMVDRRAALVSQDRAMQRAAVAKRGVRRRSNSIQRAVSP